MQNQVALMFSEPVVQYNVVALARGNKRIKFLQLRHADGGLHIRDFEIVADVAIDIFMIVPKRKGS